MSRLDRFAAESHVSVRTFKENGTSVDTPVWHVVVDGKLYFGTPRHTHKVRRLHSNANVEIAASNSRGRTRGEWISGKARILDDEFHSIKPALDKRRPVSSMLIGVIARLRRWEYLGVEVTEARPSQ